MRRILRATVVSLVAAMIMLAATTAGAQDRVDVSGTADYRNPPTLANGSYTDTIVAGEALWYAVLYTNNDPFRFEVSLDGVDLETNDELTLGALWVGPTLGTLGSRTTLIERSASYNGGETNIWYVEVVLETTGRLGVQHDLLIDVSGVQESDFELCDDAAGCTLDDDLATIDEEIAELETQIANLDTGTDPSLLETEIDTLRRLADEAEGSIEEDEAAILALCPEPATCGEPPPARSSTPAWAWIGGLVVLLGGGGLLARQLRGST